MATGKYVGEGFDFPRLNTLFLAHPISWKGTLAQYAGRLHREYEGKQDVLIYDYIDIRVPFFESMYQKRLKGYASIGYSIRNDEMLNSLFPTIDLIYNGLNFERPFISDLVQCKRSIIVSCPKVKANSYSKISDRLIELVSNGREIVVYTNEENNETTRLKQHGIDVVSNTHLSLQAAIIDKNLIWYGSVKILGFHYAEDNLIRFKNPEIATSLLASLPTRSETNN